MWMSLKTRDSYGTYGWINFKSMKYLPTYLPTYYHYYVMQSTYSAIYLFPWSINCGKYNENFIGTFMKIWAYDNNYYTYLKKSWYIRISKYHWSRCFTGKINNISSTGKVKFYWTEANFRRESVIKTQLGDQIIDHARYPYLIYHNVTA